MPFIYLLDHSASVRLQGQFKHISFHSLRQHGLLELVAMFKEFLNDIISEDIGHQLEGIWSNLRKDDILFVRSGRLKLLLDEPRAVLIAAKFNNMIIDVLPVDMLVYGFRLLFYKIRQTLSSYRFVFAFFRKSSSNMLLASPRCG